MSTSEKQVDREELDPTKPQAIYSPEAVMLDNYHHDQPERHLFGLAFHNPVDPQPGGAVALPGTSDTPAREDHVHPIQTVAPAGWWGAANSIAVSASALVNHVLSNPAYAYGFHLSGGKAVCDTAGKYLILVNLSGTTNGTNSLYLDCHITVDRPIGTVLAYQSFVPSGWANLTSGYWVASGSGSLMIDLQVGDAVYFATAINGGTWTTDGRCTLVIMPVGGMPGPPGPTGPSIVAAQSSYLFANCTGPAGNLASGAATALTWTPIFANGISAPGSANAFFTQTGKYRYTAVIGFYASSAAVSRIDLLINHYDSTGSTLKAQRRVIASTGATGYQFQGIAETILDVVAGDFAQVYVQPNAAGVQLDFSGAYTWLEITPIGGVKGDTGATGPDITLVQSSYYYGHLISPASIGTGAFATMGWTTDLSNNISLPSSSNVTISQAGKYRVATQVSTQTSGAGGAALTTSIVQYSSGGVVKATRNTVNALPSAASQWATAFAEAILDCAAGDYIQVQAVGTGAASVPDPRSWIEVSPVGGTKGDPGIQGPSGGPVPAGGTAGQTIIKQSSVDFAVAWGSPVGAWNALPLGNGWTNYGAPWQTARYRLENAGATVRVEGLIAHGAVLGGDTTFAILPVGFRPASSQIFSGDIYQGSETICFYAINSDGTCVARGGWSTAATVGFFSFMSITFGLN